VIFELEGANADFPYILAETRTPIVPAGTTNLKTSSAPADIN
jgi:hypothetical protein